MTPRGNMPKLGSSLAAAIAFSIGLCAGTPGAYADETVVMESSGGFNPGSDRALTRRPQRSSRSMRFWHRQRGPRPGALQLAP
jgi:hypothetical protein